jgi:hypothetical protein
MERVPKAAPRAPSGELTETVSRNRQSTDGLTVSIRTVSHNRQLENRQLDRQLALLLATFPGSEVIPDGDALLRIQRWNDHRLPRRERDD